MKMLSKFAQGYLRTDLSNNRKVLLKDSFLIFLNVAVLKNAGHAPAIIYVLGLGKKRLIGSSCYGFVVEEVDSPKNIIIIWLARLLSLIDGIARRGRAEEEN